MFRSIVMSACLAGLGAGVVLTIVQQPIVAPIILAAEAYESAAMPERAAIADPRQHEHAATRAAAGHAHDARAWAPEDAIERTFWSLAANVGAAIGFALLLCAVYTLLPNITVARGVCWGVAGFVVFFANPGIGLHPEIPGAMSAHLFERQLWWTFTAMCSAAAVALFVWRRTSWAWGAAAALLVVPHLLGAPQPAAHSGLAAQALAQQFIWATTLVNAVFWLTLGVMSALAFRRFATQAIAAP